MAARQYRLGGFTIAVHSSKKRIYVQPCNLEDHESRKIPSWIFESPEVIWVAEGSAPLSVRAIRGEQIKRQIKNGLLENSSSHLTKI